jgi:hypothetical protein
MWESGPFGPFTGHFTELFEYTLGGACRVVEEPSSYLEVVKEDPQVRCVCVCVCLYLSSGGAEARDFRPGEPLGL